MRATRSCAAIGVALGLTLVATSCSSAPDASSGPGSVAGVPAAAGALYVVRHGPVGAWDPQRLSAGPDMAFAGRVFQRTLTAWAPATRPNTLPALAPDLATDTGKVSKGGRSWAFTLRQGVAWQDGRPVTCADVKYGISRTYATGQITGGLTYALDLLDVPYKSDGSSVYAGPYLRSGQKAYDKAVTCSGQTITFRLGRPVADFNQVVALSAFAPVRVDQDAVAPSATRIFSNGPYKLKAPWQTGRGATFVRNPQWHPATDQIRKAHPEQLIYQEGIPLETVFSKIMTNSGSDAFAVTADSAPQVLQNDILSNPEITARSSNPRGPFVDYLLPNFSRPAMGNRKVRQALAVATNRQSYVNALGGASAAEPTFAMINKSLPAYAEFNPLKVPPRGDPVRARTLLQASGLSLPVDITVAYRRGPLMDIAMVALKRGWDEAGFTVTLAGIEKDYFTKIASVATSRNYDVMWAVGSAEWPSGSSVIPSLFDSRLNLSAGSSGQDYGRFASAGFSAKIDAAARIADPSRREKAWGALDRDVAVNVTAIALTNSKSVFVRGSGVADYIDNQALFGTVDLATVSVR